MLPFLNLAFEVGEGGEGSGELTLALLVLACLILPFNLFVMFMQKKGLESFGLEANGFREFVKPAKKVMTYVHVLFGSLLVAVMVYHTIGAWQEATIIALHYAAVVGMIILLVTGLLAMYVPLPAKWKRGFWTAHAKYVLFAAVIATIGFAHLFGRGD